MKKYLQYFRQEQHLKGKSIPILEDNFQSSPLTTRGLLMKHVIMLVRVEVNGMVHLLNNMLFIWSAKNAVGQGRLELFDLLFWLNKQSGIAVLFAELVQQSTREAVRNIKICLLPLPRNFISRIQAAIYGTVTEISTSSRLIPSLGSDGPYLAISWYTNWIDSSAEWYMFLDR